MKTLKNILLTTIFFALLLLANSCITDTYAELGLDDANTSVIVTYGTPYYYNGSLLYYMYGGRRYYYPRYYYPRYYHRPIIPRQPHTPQPHRHGNMGGGGAHHGNHGGNAHHGGRH